MTFLTFVSGFGGPSTWRPQELSPQERYLLRIAPYMLGGQPVDYQESKLFFLETKRNLVQLSVASIQDGFVTRCKVYDACFPHGMRARDFIDERLSSLTGHHSFDILGDLFTRGQLVRDTLVIECLRPDEAYFITVQPRAP